MQDLLNYELAHQEIRPKVALVIPVNHWKNANQWGDFHFAISLRKALIRKGFDVSIKLKDESVPDYFDVVIVLRGLKSGFIKKTNQVAFIWNISHPEDISDSELDMYDEVLVASPLFTRQVESRIKRKAHTLLQCTDPEVFYPESSSVTHDVLFVGNSRNILRESVKYAIKEKADLAVYGYGWENLINRKFIRLDYIDNNILHLMYSGARIVLNDHWEDMKTYGFISNRIFDALACNATVLTDYVEGIDQLVPQNQISIYKSEKDFHDLLHNLSAQSSEINTREVIIQHHTFEARADYLSNLILKYL